MAKDKKNMGYLGEDFQFRLVHEFISDKEFFTDLYDIVDQNMFTDPNLKTVVGVMKEHYAKYESVPSYSILKESLFARAKNEIEHEYYNEIVDKIHKISTDGVGYTRDLAFKFFKQQNIIKTANEILRIAGSGDVEHYDRCVELLTNTLNAGEKQELGSKPFDNEEEVLSDDYRIAIPTGIGKIDETLEGGLGKGELGAIVGPSSFGKAQPLDARILTPTGYKLMGDIKIDDEVIGCDGKPHKVIGVYPQGKRPIYKVSFSNGTSCECDIEHLWDVKSRTSNVYETITLGEINKKIDNEMFEIPKIKNVSLDIEDINDTINIINAVNNIGGHCNFLPIGNRHSINITFNEAPIYMTGAEYVGEKEAQCIMVDCEDHRYVTEDFIVTHNTSLTTAIAAYAATHKCEQNNYDGFKVLQLVFEDRIKQIQRKHFGRITGVEAKDLSKAEFIEDVKRQLAAYEDKEMLQNNLRIVRWPSGEKSAWDVEKLIKRLKNNGFSPDLVIVDYFECLANRRGSLQKDDWSKEAENMRKFEAMAGEMNIAFWIPIQGTRDSVNAELVTMDKAGGSFKKIQIAHIVMTIARTVEDIENNIATVAILKNRAGQSGKIFNNVEFNNGTCRISTDHVDEYSSMAMYNKEKERQIIETQRDVFLKSTKAKPD